MLNKLRMKNLCAKKKQNDFKTLEEYLHYSAQIETPKLT
jgi:hypothetical protein